MKKLSKQTWVFVVVLLIIGASAVFLTLDAAKYKNEKKVPVVATVTAMEEYDRSSGGSRDRGYDVYVDYAYEGKTYEHISYTSVSLSTELNIGDTLDLQVYERNPAAIAQDAKGFAVYFWVLFAAGVVFVGFRVKNDLKIAEEKQL